ncbi:MAG: response regulator [Planctomycetaceae bacterium]|nr:response regulator [Planctomycetaceae bacterium]
MTQVYLVEAPGSQRDALAFVLRDARIAVQVCDDPGGLPDVWPRADKLLVIVAEAQLSQLEPLQARFRAAPVIVWALLEPGSFAGLIEALRVGATEVVSSDRPARDVVALVRSELSSPLGPEPDADSSGVTVEVVGRAGSFRVPPERLLGLLAQMCDDVGRLQRRYAAELEQRRRVEQALMESEAFYQSLVETLPLALFRKDINGRVTFANQRFCEVLKRPASEILGRTDYDFFPRDLAEKYRADDRRVMETRLNFETTEEFQTPSGEQRYNHVVKTPVYDANGRLVGIQGVFSDVTDRILTETALEQERYLLDSLMTNIPDNIYFKDSQGRYLRINPAKARRSGLTNPADAIGRSDFDFFPADHAQAALADELQVLQSGEPLIGKEELISYTDGTQAWMSTTKLPLKDRQGRVIGTFGVSHDISPLKLAQDALRRAAEAAEGANRAKSDFLANMSHEIRTPLNAVMGMTELVLGTPLTPVQRDYLKLVHESGESLLAVINDILDFSKIEAGKFRLDHAAFEFREFLGDTLKSLGLRAHRKGLELACEIEPEVPEFLVGDANRVRQVVVNLIGNAIKFTETGEVLVSVNVEPPAAEEAPDSSDETVQLHFQVADTGIGIPSEKFQTIFEAFEQADASTTRKFGGTGLGLAISARLVELMGGRIWVESEVGRGSTFHFTATFQIASEHAERCAPAPPELLQGLRVLVVDDNSTNRRILAEMLASWGMSPVLAASAHEALSELRAQASADNPYSLIITDVNMPELSGFDLVRAAHEDGSLCCGIIVMLTSSDRSDDVQACEQLGVETYLIKPIKQSELFNAILQALGARHAEEWKTATIAANRDAARSLRILLAEDSMINQKLAVGLLERWGHTVDVAENGCQALAKVQARRYDLVLMDVQMPELDGLAATTAIRDWERTTGLPRLPIVAMTAHALPGDRDRCLAAGMDDYITKPIRSEVLFQSLELIGNALTAADAESLAEAPIEKELHSAAAISPDQVPVEEDAVPLQLVNWEHVRSIVDHDETLLRDIADAFCLESPTIWQRLQSAVASREVKVFERAVHTLKNSLATFGAESARQLAMDLESRAKRDHAVPAEEDCRPLGVAISAVVAELTHFLRRGATAEKLQVRA